MMRDTWRCTMARSTAWRAIAAALLLACGLPATADEIHVVVSGGLTPAFKELVPAFEKQSGHHVITEAGSSLGTTPTAIPMRLDRGEAIDLLLMVRDGIPALIARHQVDEASVVDLARSKIAMAVRKGAPLPDIRSVAAFRRTLLQARSVAYSDSASGVYLRTELFQRLGIDKEMAAKSRTVPGTPVGEAVARGEFELGFQQYSELLAVPGIQIVGMLPDELQKITMYSAALPSGARAAAAAKALIAFLASDNAAGVIRRSGLDPLASTPTQQQAVVQSAGNGDALKLQSVPVLEPRENEVLIRIHAAAVNPADYRGRAEAASRAPVGGAAPPDVVPGQDAAGVVEKLGPGVTGLKVGDSVWAIIARRAGVLNGGYAHYAVAAAANVLPKPRNLTFAEASGLGVAGVTGVRDVSVTNVAKGQRVLITGVAGGVGSFAAQAAKARGAYVIGTATPKHNKYLESIGVDEVIDYSQGRFEDKVRNVDVVIDTVGSDTAQRAMGTLRKGGQFISNAGAYDEQCKAAGVVCAPRSGAAAAGRAVFEEVGTLASAGKLKVNIDKTFPLAEAAQAQAYSEAGHAEGKIILIVDAGAANRR